MTIKSILSLAFLLCFSLKTFSQITNTKKWRKTENDSMRNALILFDEKRYALALPIYEKLYNNHPKEVYLKYCYGKCALYRSDKHETALTLLNEIYTKTPKIENIQYDLARANHLNYKFDEALALIELAVANKHTLPQEKLDCKILKEYCINAKQFYNNPTSAKITNAGNVINSIYEEYSPVINADETVMIFTYRGIESLGGLQNEFMQPDKYGSYFEDVFVSYKENELWTKPKSVSSSINTNLHDAPIALSVDGQALFTYKDNGDDHGDLYISTQQDTSWTVPQKLKGEVNSYSWEGNCSMTADGKNLYFSSERGGGYGGKDIYRATLLSDSVWGNVVNLGDSINTAFDDDAPFIHPDGITLFYSSKGKNSMGGYDILQAKLKWQDSTFSKPINLGYPINTPDDDIYYVLSANGERGYYASGKKGGEGLKDIYSVTPGYVGKKPSAFILKGKITYNNEPVEADIIVEFINKNTENKQFGQFNSRVYNGNYLVSLPSGAEFVVKYKYKNFPYKTLDLSTANLDGYDEKIFDVNFTIPDTLATIAKVDSVKKDTVIAVIEKPKPVVPAFVPKNNIQSKTMDYAAKYGDISTEGLIFKVQIAAYKYPKNYVYKHLKGLGEVENLLLDGITRITIGGNFETLNKAFDHNKKVIKAGQPDAFVTVLYQGKRVYLEDLEKMGIFK